MKAFEITVKADRLAVSELLNWLADVCKQLEVSTDNTRRFAVLIEELFLNTVDHGYAGNGGPAIHYHLSNLGDNHLELVQRDQASAFDIAQATAQTATLERVGGLGIALIQGMSRKVAYRREGDVNVTTLVL